MKIICLALSLVFFVNLKANKYTISGYVQNAASGEKIIGAAVFDNLSKNGTVSNSYGFYSFSLPEGKVELLVSSIGYTDYKTEIELKGNMTLNIDLIKGVSIEKVVISKNKKNAIHENSQMSTVTITPAEIKKIPAILGESDLIKALQLLPGVHSGNEGSAGFYVRGGGPDQNLILLDGAPLYNVSHLFGFFSTFNPDALNNVSLIKGGFPARYGGRLSSVLDISMKEGDMKKYHGEASIGLIASRFTVEGPIIKDKASFIISARRTYVDLLTAIPALLMSKGKQNGGLFFYDLNGKINYKISDKDRVYLSLYNGEDKFYFKEKNAQNKMAASLNWGNLTGTARWNHLVNQKIFVNSSLIYSKYFMGIENKDEETLVDPRTGKKSTNTFVMKYNSGIQDYLGKIEVDYIPTNRHYVRLGINHTYHSFTTGAFTFKQVSFDQNKDTAMGKKPFYSHESHAYIEDDIKITEKLKTNIGLHFSGGKMREKYFPFLEPRISVRYLLAKKTAVKASFCTMHQFVHLLSTSTIGLPTDLWVPATDLAPPQKGWQVALGFAQPITIKNEVFEVSIEGYYKEMKSVIAYKEGASFFGSGKTWESLIEKGKGDAYGGEFLIQKKYGKLSGWIGYTLSWTNRQFDNINGGKKYPYRYDRRHDISVVGMYDITEKISLSMTWVYGTGNSVTLPAYQYLIPESYDYSGSYSSVTQANSINGYKMPSTHRLDLNVAFRKKKKYGERTWMVGAYNVYNRKNAFYIYTEGDKLKQKSLFPIIPAISYNYKF